LSTGEKCKYHVDLKASGVVDDVDCKQILDGNELSAITSKLINVTNDNPRTIFLFEFIDKSYGRVK
jgi:hypothetical protein